MYGHVRKPELGSIPAGTNHGELFARMTMSTRLQSKNGFVSIAFAVVIIIFSGIANAQNVREQVVGTWTAVSQYVEQNGKKLEPFGSNPKGMVVYDRAGHFILVL